MSGWHIDKNIQVATVILVLTQTAAIVWYAATMTAQLEFMSTQLTAYEERSETLRENQVLLERLVDVHEARLEEHDRVIYGPGQFK